jgi:hypothetical protein
MRFVNLVNSKGSASNLDNSSELFKTTSQPNKMPFIWRNKSQKVNKGF